MSKSQNAAADGKLPNSVSRKCVGAVAVFGATVEFLFFIFKVVKVWMSNDEQFRWCPVMV